MPRTSTDFVQERICLMWASGPYRGQYVERDDSTGPMSTGGYPMATTDPLRATVFATEEKALAYASHGFQEMKLWYLYITIEESNVRG